MISPRLIAKIESEEPAPRLAVLIDADNAQVLGFGEQKTPDAFRRACNKFILTEVLRPSVQAEPAVSLQKNEPPIVKAKATPTQQSAVEFPTQFVLDALEKSGDDAGWAHLGTFGSYLTKLKPDFDPRLFGFKKLSELVKAKTDIFVTDERASAGQTQKVLYVRAR